MPLILRESSGKDFEPVPAGTHQAVCFRIWDLGTQPGGQWDPKRQILISWELPEQRIDIDGNDLPMSLSRRFTNSLHKKSTLRPFLEGWRGRQFSNEELMGFDLTSIVGVNCMLQVMHRESNNRTFANITAAMPLMANFEKLKPENTSFCWSLDDGTPIPEETPKWVSELIEGSAEWNNEAEAILANDRPVTETPPEDDDIPF
jgi:hypothetical protein